MTVVCLASSNLSRVPLGAPLRVRFGVCCQLFLKEPLGVPFSAAASGHVQETNTGKREAKSFRASGRWTGRETGLHMKRLIIV